MAERRRNAASMPTLITVPDKEAALHLRVHAWVKKNKSKPLKKL